MPLFTTTHCICILQSFYLPGRETGVESTWAAHRPSPSADDAGTSAVRSIGLGRVQMMMRHLASVGENYAHGSLEDSSWNIWPSPVPSGPSVPPSFRNGRGSMGLRFRNTSPTPSVSENMLEILAMADRVREVLPHIPDELIIQVFVKGYFIISTPTG